MHRLPPTHRSENCILAFCGKVNGAMFAVVNKPVLICLFSFTVAPGFLICKQKSITLCLGCQRNFSIIQKKNLKVTMRATHCSLERCLFSLPGFLATERKKGREKE
jgi:hypothetical protein